jgi:hypothetical protein
MPKVEGWVDRLNGFRRSRDESDMQAQKRSYDLELDTVRMMHRYDVHFMIGTDAEAFYPAGFGLHKELSFFVSAGFSTLETLQAATLNPATYLGRQKDMGRGKTLRRFFKPRLLVHWACKELWTANTPRCVKQKPFPPLPH